MTTMAYENLEQAILAKQKAELKILTLSFGINSLLLNLGDLEDKKNSFL